MRYLIFSLLIVFLSCTKENEDAIYDWRCSVTIHTTQTVQTFDTQQQADIFCQSNNDPDVNITIPCNCTRIKE